VPVIERLKYYSERCGTPLNTILVFAGSLAIRLACLGLNPHVLTVGLERDAQRYDIMARTLLQEGVLTFQGHLAMMSPLYPMFVAGCYALPGPDRLAVLLAQAVLGATMTAAIYLICRRLFSEKAALVSALFGALYYPLIAISQSVLSEALFIPLLVFSLLAALCALHANKNVHFALAGILTGLACLCRPVILYFPPMLVLVALAGLLRRKLNIRLLGLALYLTCFYLTLSPWAYRNWRELGTPVFTSTNTGMVLATSVMPRHGKLFGFDLQKNYMPPEDRHILDLPELERNQALKELAINHLISHPQEIPRETLLKTMYFLSPFDWEIMGHLEGVFNPWFVLVSLLAALALARMGWNTGRVLTVAIPFYFAAISFATYASPRLRLPILPVLIILAGAGWIEFEGRLSSKARYLVGTLAVLLSTAGFIYSYQIKLFCRELLVWLGVW
jgi:4-amino-4-deoxy-L-arabinose transferase-like glycosyltransferase